MSYWVTYSVNQLVQAALIVFGPNEACKMKKSFSMMYFWISAVCALLNILMFVILKPANAAGILSAIQSLFVLVSITWLTEGKWKQKLRSAAVLTTSSLLTELSIIVIVRVVYGVDPNDLGTMDKLETVISILALEFYYAWIMLIILLFRRKDESFRRMIPICLINTLIAVLFSAISIFYNMNGADKMNRQDIFINQMTHCLITVLLIVLYYAMKSSISKAQDEERLAGMEDYILQTRRFYELAEQKYSEAAKIRHDIRNQVQTIEYLISEEDIAESRSSLRSLKEKYSEIGIKVYSDVPAVNVIMSIKLNECDENGITTDVVLRDCGKLPFDNYELCSVFSNIMDNAINACRLSKGGHITIKSQAFGDTFALKAENPVPAALTPKRNRKGYGIEIIKSITLKYGGTYSAEETGNIFTSLLTVPINK